MEQNRDLSVKKYFELLGKRRYLFAAAAACIITLAVAASHLIPPVYEAKTIVSIEKNMLNDIIRGIGSAQSGDDKVKALSTIMRSRTLVSKVINDLGFVNSGMTELQVESLIKETQDRTDINIEFNRASKKDIDYFVVSFRHRNPSRARDYVNSLVSRYIEENLYSKREGSFGANRFLLDQINLFRDKVAGLNAQIAALRKNRTILFYARYSELQKRLDDLLVQYTDTYPEVIRVKADIESVKSKYRTSSDPGKQFVTLSDAASLMNKLAALEEQRNSANKIYEELSATYGKTEMSAQAEIQDKAGTFRIVDPAVLPVKPASPNRLVIILLGVLGGLAGAFFLIIAVDTADHSIKEADALKQFAVPVLSVIPHIESKNDIVRTRRKDRYFYGISGLFVVLLITFILRELLS